MFNAHEGLYDGTMEPTVKNFARVVAPTFCGLSFNSPLRFITLSPETKQNWQEALNNQLAWTNMPRALKEREYEAQVMKSLHSIRRSNVEARERGDRYAAMVKALNAWTPSKELAELKGRMLEILNNRVHDTWEIPWKIPTFEVWEESHYRLLVTMTLSFEADWNRHQQYVETANKFLEACRDELGLPVASPKPSSVEW